MGQYRVTMTLDFIVNINDENALADPRAALRGDTPETAVNRASWCWIKGMGLARETCRTLGVGRTSQRKADVQVVTDEQIPKEPTTEPSDGPV